MAKKSEQGHLSLKSDIRSGQIKNLYIFHGEESYLKEHYLGTLSDAICGGGFGDFDKTVLEGRQITVDAMRDSVDTLPVGGERKLLVLRDFNLTRAGESVRDAFLALISDLPPYICVVLYFETLEYKPDKRQKLWTQLLGRASVINFERAERSELVIWLKRRFQALGKEIETQTCEFMLFHSGNLMTGLVGEVDKIAAGAKCDRIGRHDIEQMGAKVIDAKIYELTDCVAKQEFGQAFSILGDLFSMRTEPIALLMAITRQVQRLYGARLAIDSGLSAAYLVKLFSLSSEYPAKLLLKNASRLSLASLRRMQLLCQEADGLIKSNLPDEPRVIELLILKMSGEAQ